MAMPTHLKEWMDHYGVTSEMIAFKTGMSVKVLDKYLSGETTPSLPAIKTISETIGVSIDDILNATPSEVIDIIQSQEHMHVIETTSHKVAVRMQNYLAQAGRTCRVIAIVGDTESFIIQYDGEIIDIADIYKISKKLKYRDSREKCDNEDIRFKDMELSRM